MQTVSKGLFVNEPNRPPNNYKIGCHISGKFIVTFWHQPGSKTKSSRQTPSFVLFEIGIGMFVLVALAFVVDERSVIGIDESIVFLTLYFCCLRPTNEVKSARCAALLQRELSPRLQDCKDNDGQQRQQRTMMALNQLSTSYRSLSVSHS